MKPTGVEFIPETGEWLFRFSDGERRFQSMEEAQEFLDRLADRECGVVPLKPKELVVGKERDRE